VRSLLFVALVVGCGSAAEEPTLATAHSGVHMPVIACWAGDDTCGAHGYCDTTRCDRPGTCRPRPVVTNTYDPVCGCDDGITYWSATLAAHLGVAAVGGACDKASNTGLRPDPLLCQSDGDCAGGRCITIGCNAPESTCWHMPEVMTCDDSAFRAWKTCDASASCLTECEALQTGRAYTIGEICR
jgi:hypothetical protein